MSPCWYSLLGALSGDDGGESFGGFGGSSLSFPLSSSVSSVDGDPLPCSAFGFFDDVFSTFVDRFCPSVFSLVVIGVIC